MTHPLFASERTAARLLDMKPAEFRELVRHGHLPRAEEIAPGVPRWRVEDLQKIARGDLARPDQGLQSYDPAPRETPPRMEASRRKKLVPRIGDLGRGREAPRAGHHP